MIEEEKLSREHLFPGCGAEECLRERLRIGWDISFWLPPGGSTGSGRLGFCPESEGREGLEAGDNIMPFPSVFPFPWIGCHKAGNEAHLRYILLSDHFIVFFFSFCACSSFRNRWRFSASHIVFLLLAFIMLLLLIVEDNGKLIYSDFMALENLHTNSHNCN